VNVRVFYHDRCFDGACSAASLRASIASVFVTTSSLSTWACCTAPAPCFNEDDFTGDENAIVDFKYSPSRKITWWFDHHESAFLTPETRGNFERDYQQPQVLRPGLSSPVRDSWP